MSSFCRHNRFISECPICSKGTVLDPDRPSSRRPRSSSSGSRSSSTGGRRSASAAALARPARGPYASAGPYDGRELRLERVPGGLRLASWRGGQLEKQAPTLAADDLAGLLGEAVAKEILSTADSELLSSAWSGDPSSSEVGAPIGASGAASIEPSSATAPVALFGRSPGRSGELRDELRVEMLEDGELRIARWLMRPNRGWELQEAPVMLPAKRLVQALTDAARRGVLASGQPTA